LFFTRLFDEIAVSDSYDQLMARDGSFMTKDLRNSCMVKIQMKMPSYYEDGKPAFQTIDKLRKKIDFEDWGVTLLLTEEAIV
jgi:hypothetical protein